MGRTILSAAGLLILPLPLAAQTAPDLGTDEQRQAGRALYSKYCSQCHGDKGDGQGIATPFLRPEPRDFTRGKYKIRTTPNGTVPTDADIQRVIRRGIPDTAMPAFPDFSDRELTQLVYYLKSFARDFEDPAAYGQPLEIPRPPKYDPERAREEGLRVYQQSGCKQCHGELGRADGGTAPSLRDDWGRYIRAADLSQPWTFRAGGTREDIFRTLSTGFNGTPMASFVDSLDEQQRWLIADWIYSHADEGRLDSPYSGLLRAVGVGGELELGGDIQAARELFAAAPPALFPVVGQIMEPGRMFYPSARSVEVRSVYNQEEIAFLVSWHDMAADTAGENRPDLEAPAFLDELASQQGETAAPGGGGAEDIWGQSRGGADTGSVWGEATAEPEPAAAADVWGQDPGAALAAAPIVGAIESELSDAVAIQVPAAQPTGVRKPYFLWGDEQNPVQIWFVDLAEAPSRVSARLYEGRGSANLGETEGEAPEVVAGYDRGEWSVVFKRPRRSSGGLSFEESRFVPIAFSVWDGFNRERGNRRGLTRWFHVYLEPMEAPSPVGPMLRAGLTVLGLELLIIALVRRRRRKQAEAAAGAPQGARA